MEEHTHFESIILKYVEEGDYIHFEYIKPSQSEDFRAAWNKAQDIVKEEDCHKWLLNQQRQSIHPDDQKWVQTVWFQRTMEETPFTPENPRYVAVIQAENFFAQFSTTKFIKEHSIPGFVVNVFRTPEEGIKWLAEMDAKAIH